MCRTDKDSMSNQLGRVNTKHLDVRVIGRCSDELWEAFAEPHGNVSFHVDGKGLEPLLQPTDGEVTEAADILT